MATTQVRVTEAEFLRLPDDGRKVELVKGELHVVPTGVFHDIVGANLVLLLGPSAKGRGYLTISQAGWRMRSGNIRCPDVAFTRKERFAEKGLPQGFGEGAPDLCIEIISPSEEARAMQEKVEEYFASGAVQVWHLFPESQEVKVYTSPNQSRVLTAGETLEAGELLPHFSCKVEEIFTLD